MSNARGRRGARPGRAGGSTRSGATRTGGTRSGATRPDASRPGQRRESRHTTGPVRTLSAARRPLLTGRAVLLGTLVLLLALTLAGPMRQYVAGRQELAELAAEGTALDQRVADLQEELERQADPAYTQQQALSRLAYVLPGDRLVVVADGQATEGNPGTISDPTPAEPLPWYEGLLASVAGADGDGDGEEPAG